MSCDPGHHTEQRVTLGINRQTLLLTGLWQHSILLPNLVKVKVVVISQLFVTKDLSCSLPLWKGSLSSVLKVQVQHLEDLLEWTLRRVAMVMHGAGWCDHRVSQGAETMPRAHTGVTANPLLNDLPRSSLQGPNGFSLGPPSKHHIWIKLTPSEECSLVTGGLDVYVSWGTKSHCRPQQQCSLLTQWCHVHVRLGLWPLMGVWGYPSELGPVYLPWDCVGSGNCAVLLTSCEKLKSGKTLLAQGLAEPLHVLGLAAGCLCVGTQSTQSPVGSMWLLSGDSGRID